MMPEKAPTSVDAYVEAAPEPARAHLRRLRAEIRAAAPKAEEKISYGMPYYEYRGRLIYFGAFKNHVGVYSVGRALTDYADELEPYLGAKSTLRFPYAEPLPLPLIRKVLKTRVREVEERGC